MTPSNDPPRVLVTGATGFLGAHIVLALLEAGFRVRGTVRDIARAEQRFAALPIPEVHRARLSFVAAELGRDEGWAAAARECRFVVHVASPVPQGPTRDAREVIGPARDGTLRVLRAAHEARVERVVLTSSTAAVIWGHARDGSKIYDEGDWTFLSDAIGPYEQSKTLAERAAWDYVATLSNGFELVAILPGAILGPLLDDDFSVSGQIVRALLTRALPGCPDLGFALVDVRDVAAVHVQALTHAAAAGRRFIVAGEHTSMREIAEVLGRNFGPRGFEVPTRRLPSWLIKVMALWDANAGLIAGELGKRQDVSNARAREVFGWSPRGVEAMIVEMAESMIRHGVVAAPKQRH